MHGVHRYTVLHFFTAVTSRDTHHMHGDGAWSPCKLRTNTSPEVTPFLTSLPADFLPVYRHSAYFLVLYHCMRPDGGVAQKSQRASALRSSNTTPLTDLRLVRIPLWPALFSNQSLPSRLLYRLPSSQLCCRISSSLFSLVLGCDCTDHCFSLHRLRLCLAVSRLWYRIVK